jgi:hypothetical protein
MFAPQANRSDVLSPRMIISLLPAHSSPPCRRTSSSPRAGTTIDSKTNLLLVEPATVGFIDVGIFLFRSPTRLTHSFYGSHAGGSASIANIEPAGFVDAPKGH